MPSGVQNRSIATKNVSAALVTMPASHATAAHRRPSSGRIRPAANGTPVSESVNVRTASRGAPAAVLLPFSAIIRCSAGSGKHSRNSRSVLSGSRPTASAYARRNDRRKIPDGHLDTSSRSSASKIDAWILVRAVIDWSETPRRSRSWRRRRPKPSVMNGRRSGDA